MFWSHNWCELEFIETDTKLDSHAPRNICRFNRNMENVILYNEVIDIIMIA